MKFAFSKSASAAEDIRALLTSFREAGYDGLQLKGNQYGPYLDEPGRFLDEWGQYQGTASALIAAGNLSADSVAHLRKTFSFGRAVGAELVVFCHGVKREGITADDLRGFARELSDLGKEARDFGLKLSLHHHYDQPVMHRADFDTFFDAVADRAVGLTVDTAHLAKSGVTDMAGLIRDFAHVIDNFHLKDYAAGEWRVLGEGDLDFAPVFAAVRDIGYDGWVSTDEESGAQVAVALGQCYRFMAEGLGRL